MDDMFKNCSGLTSLDLSSFNTSNVTNMGSMFYSCYNLTSITFGDKADVSKVTSYNSMFNGLPSNLIFNYDCNYDYSILLNYNNTYFKGYTNCLTKEQTWLVKLYDYTNNNELITDSSLNLTLSNGIQGAYDETQSGYTFTFTNVKDISRYDVLMNGEVIGQIRCDKFNYGFVVNLSGSYIKETIYITSTTFSYSLINSSCASYISDMYIDGVKQNNIILSYIFNEIGEHEMIYVVDSEQTLTSCENMFRECSDLTSIDLSNFDTSNVTTMYGMFNTCRSLTSLDISSFNTVNVTNMDYMFSNCYNLTSLDLSSFDTFNVTSMIEMFSYCSSLTELDLSSFNTSKVSNMYYMFNRCSGLTSLDLSSFNTSSVTNMNSMFKNCNNLTSLDLSSFDTSKVTSMIDMFSYCSSLTELDLSSFNTYKVLDMNEMFTHCYKLTSLDLSSFDTVNVSKMNNMFNCCSGLTEVDLSSFNTSNVTNMGYMFQNCRNLTSITFGYYSDVSKVTLYSYMFDNVPISCTLTLCENTINSWNKIISSYTLNVVESECYIPTTCTSLNITALDVSCRATSTTITYTAVTNGTLYGKEYNGMILTGTATSDSFEQNTDTANTITHEVTFEYMGITASTTFIQKVWVDQYYSINLNNQWQLSTSISNPDSSLYDGVYESYANKGVNNSADICIITIEGYETFTLYIRSYGESCCDYVVVSNLDCTLNSGTTSGSNDKATTSGTSQSGTAIGNYTKVDFTNIDGEQHTIQVMYRKDRSSSSGNDIGYLLIPKNQ